MIEWLTVCRIHAIRCLLEMSMATTVECRIQSWRMMDRYGRHQTEKPAESETFGNVRSIVCSISIQH